MRLIRLVSALVLLAVSTPAADPPKLLRSLSGPSGKTVGSDFVLDETRNRFVYPNDNSLVIYFQWEAPPGDHVLTGIWKQPDGRVASISPDVKIETTTTALNCYWIFTLSQDLPRGVWTLEVRVDGQPGGSHTFEIAGTEPRRLTVDDIFKTFGPSVVWIHKLNEAGGKTNLATGFVLGPNEIATAFQSIDSASSLEIEFSDGRKVTTNEILSFSRTGDWAIVRADSGSLGPIPRGDSSKLLIGERLGLFTFDSGTRMISGVDIGGQGVVEGFGSRIQIAPPVPPEAAGGPLIDPSGHVVGILGGSLRPGSRIEQRASGGDRDMIQLLAHGAGGTQITSATSLSEIPVQVPTLAKTLDQLDREGALTPALSPMPEMIYGGISAEIPKRSYNGIPPETTEFSVRDPEVGVFSQWTRKDKLSKGNLSVFVYDVANKLRLSSQPTKITLRKEQPQQFSFKFSPALLGRGTYRIDILWNGRPTWRAFIRITE